MEEEVDDIKEIVHYQAGVFSQNPEEQYECTKWFRKILSNPSAPPIDAVVEAGVVPRFVQFLSFNDHPKLQFEAVWTLSNISGGTTLQKKYVVDVGAIPPLVRLATLPEKDVAELSIRCLGNIAGESNVYRDMVLKSGGMEALLSTFDLTTSNLQLLRTATWSLSNLFRGKPPPAMDAPEPALRHIRHLIMLDDENVLISTCLALSYISEGKLEWIQEVMEANVCYRLVELMLHASRDVRELVIRTIGNLLRGGNQDIAAVIFAYGLPALRSLLHNSSELAIQKEAVRAVAVLTSGPYGQIDRVIESGLIEELVQLFEHHSNDDIAKEALAVFANVSSGGSPYQIRKLVEKNCIVALFQVLGSSQASLLEVALDALTVFLEAGQQAVSGTESKFVLRVKDMDGFQQIVKLQSHSVKEIRDKARNLVDRYSSTTDTQQPSSAKPSTFKKASPAKESLKSKVGRLREQIESDNEEILAEACEKLSEITDGGPHEIEAVVNAKVCHRLVKLITHPSQSVKLPALRTIGNIATGNDEQTSAVLQANALPILRLLLQSDEKTVHKEAAWIVSNIAAGSHEQIKALIHEKLVEEMVQLTTKTADDEVQKEAYWAIANALKGSPPGLIPRLVQLNCIEVLCLELVSEDEPNKVIHLRETILDAFLNVLSYGDLQAAEEDTTENPYIQRIQNSGCIPKIEQLLNANQHGIQRKAERLITEYFSAD